MYMKHNILDIFVEDSPIYGGYFPMILSNMS